MKKILYPLLFITLTTFSSCRKVQKNAHNYYPEVITTSVTVMPDGSVQVTGTIISTGSTNIDACGICMDTIPHPDMISNQTIARKLTGNTFSCGYASLDATKKYYFRAWAVNDNGYAIGDDVSVANVSFDTSLIPCHPENHHMVLSGPTAIDEAYTHVSPPSPSALNYEVTGYTDNHSIDINFAVQPISGIYTTAGGDEPSGSYIVMTVDAIKTDAGAKVYVQQINATTIDITICEVSCYANYGFSIAHFNMTTKVRCPS